MTCVVVYADEKDKEFFDKLNEFICSAFTPLTIWKGDVTFYGDHATLLFCDHESIHCNNLSPKIIIFGGRGQYDLSQVNTEQTVVIVDSCDQERLAYVSSTRLPAVTCGLFAKDTITLSSMTGDSAVVNLQRSIPCFNGDVAEPQEIPVRLACPMDEYLLMAAASIYLLTGNSDRLIALAPETF